MDTDKLIRPMRYAGSWYDDDPDLLGSTISNEIAAALQRLDSIEIPFTHVRLGMLPHAGLYYSARGTAAFFSLLPPAVSRILIIAPSHYSHLSVDTLTTAPYEAFETPFGKVSAMTLHEILPSRIVLLDRRAADAEHALEMFLPFCAWEQQEKVRKLEAGACLVSRISGAEAVDMLAEAVLEAVGNQSVLDGRTVIIASSDFTHYGSRFGYTPFGSAGSGSSLPWSKNGSADEITAIERKVRAHDREYAELFASGNIDELVERQQREDPTICGFAPGLIAASIAGKLNLPGIVADQYNSNDITGSRRDSDFVSYCSILWGR